MSQPQQQPNPPEISEAELALMNDPKVVWDVVREAGSIICTGSYSYCSNHIKLISEFDDEASKRYKVVLHNSTAVSDYLLKKNNGRKLIRVMLPTHILPIRPASEIFPVTEPVYSPAPKTTKSRVEEYLNKLKNK